MQYIKDPSITARENIEEYRFQLRGNFDELTILKDHKKEERAFFMRSKKDLEHHKENRKRKGELYCHQTLLMYYPTTKEWTKACEEILKAIEGKTEFKFHFLTYLMLSCYYYQQK